MKNFWQKLKKPFFVLAPMANVTDMAFRKIIAKYGKPDVMWTEFVSADGIFLGNRDILMKDLVFSKKEKPIVAQFFTARPDMMERASRLALELGFDGVDINMGCPDKSVIKQGAGAALCRNMSLARELIRSAKSGVQDKLPISVKIRLGYNSDILEDWLSELLSEKPSAVILHARTKKDMSKVPARWDRVKKAVEIRDEFGSETLIIGNGDVVDLDDGRKKAKETGCDGVMLGKAIFGRPFLFSKSVGMFDNRTNPMTIKKILSILVEHTRLFENLLMNPPVGGKHFAIMKKHFKSYTEGFPGAKELRAKLMETKDSNEVKAVVNNYLKIF